MTSQATWGPTGAAAVGPATGGSCRGGGSMVRTISGIRMVLISISRGRVRTT